MFLSLSFFVADCGSKPSTYLLCSQCFSLYLKHKQRRRCSSIINIFAKKYYVVALWLGNALSGTISSHAQQYLRSKDQLITSFYTTQHRRVVIAAGTGEKYIVYRCGTDKKTELEYPPCDSTGYKMAFYWYLRPAGGGNEGLDMYSLLRARHIQVLH